MPEVIDAVKAKELQDKRSRGETLTDDEAEDLKVYEKKTRPDQNSDPVPA